MGRKAKFILILLLAVLAGCNNEKMSYELTGFESEVTDHPDIIQVEFQYDIVNDSDEDYYLTFVFPGYIQEALVESMSPMQIPAGTSSFGGGNIAISKDGGQMTEETVKSILEGEIPHIEEIVIGKAVSSE